MGILGWIVFGLIVGALAKLVMPGRDPGGFVVTAGDFRDCPIGPVDEHSYPAEV